MRSVHSTPVAVADVLASLGLSRDDLVDVLVTGEASRDSCTPHHPPAAPGFYSWADTVRALRDLLVLRGWTADDSGNFSVVVEPEGTFAIAVATGDDATGATGSGEVPKTKYEKGARTLAAVAETQLALFAQIENKKKDDESAPPRATWFLLRRRVGEYIFAELSLPAAVEGDKIVDWSVRVILGPIHFDPTGGRIPEDGDSSGPDVEVPVTRRQLN